VRLFTLVWQRACWLAQRDWVMLPCTVCSLAVYLAAHHARGFVPHDEGLLAQSAERVLRGEWPHRAFDDPYTGLLSVLHAGAFLVFGVDLLALRRMLLLAAIGFSAVVYRLARRVASPALSAFTSWIALAWAMPSYFAALPSWYNLMAAAMALLFFLRAAEHGRRVDVALAGVCGGLSLLVKLVGLFHIAASLLGLLFWEVSRGAPVANRNAARAAHWFVRVSALIFALAVSALLRADAPIMERLHFTAPSWLLAWVLIVESMRSERRSHAPRLRSLFATFLSYGAGVALPTILFVWPYLRSGDSAALVYDVFIAPQRRIAEVNAGLPRLWTLIAAVPAAVVVLAPGAPARMFQRPLPRLLLAALMSLLLGLGFTVVAYKLVWMSLRPLVPLAALGGALLLTRTGSATPLQRTQLFGVVAMAALASLVQFPYAFGVYFLYVAPLLVLALLFIAARQQPTTRGLWLTMACFYLGFALLWVNTGLVRTLGARYVPEPHDTYLALPRGGLYVAPQYARAYTDLVRTIQAHSADSSYIYAAPDCPEVYFLSHRQNPTRTFYDLFDRDYTAAPELRVRRILDALESHHIDVTVICRFPEFSSRISASLERQLELRYPRRRDVTPLFSVRFRDRPATQHDDSGR
jgi:hypothetical protein